MSGTDCVPGTDRVKDRGNDGARPVSLAAHPAFLHRLRSTVCESYASMAAIRQEAVAVIETAIVRLSKPDARLDPALKSELIAKYGILLTQLEDLQSLLPRGRTGALESLDGLAALLRQLEEERRRGR